MQKNEELTWLEEQWHQLLADCRVSVPKASYAYQEVLEQYGKSGRKYHNFHHLVELLQAYMWVEEMVDHKLEVRTAIWFHDLIYQPLRKDNELRSARRALLHLRDWETSKLEERTVFDLIVSTRNHQPLWDHPDCHLFLDLDLGILGRERARYEAYTQEIREEYKMVPAPLYRSGRKKVVNSFLGRPRLYFTNHFFERLETRARENLTWELEQLEGN
ncbi:MAG: hypothetical protein AAGI38_17360 [Bacteroidota bacterium]